MEGKCEGDCVRALKPRLFSPVFVVIVLISLAGFMVGQGSNAGTSVYLAEVGSTAAYAGVLAAIFSAAAAIARIVCGPLIDGRGRAMVMVVGSAIMLAGTLGPLFSNDLALFVLWRFMQGVGFSAVTTASATAAADVLPVERLGEGIGYFGLGQAVAMSIGPALALSLVMTDPAENLFIGLSGCALAALAFSFLCRYEKDPTKLPKTSAYRFRWEERHAAAEDRSVGQKSVIEIEDHTPEQHARSALGRFLDGIFEKRALPGTIPMLVIAPAFGFAIFYVGLYGTALGVGSPGLFYTVSAVVMVLVRLKSGPLMDRTPLLRIYAVAVAGGLVAYALLFAAALVPAGIDEVVFYAGGAFYGLCIGLALPVNQSVAVKGSPSHRWGKATALFMFSIDIGTGVASLIWGIVNDVFGFSVAIVCVMVCLVASFLLAWACYPASEKQARYRS